MLICLRPRTPNPPFHTVCIRVYSIHIHTGKGGGGGRESSTRKKVRGATVHKAGSKMPIWLTLSPLYKLWKTPTAKSLYRSIFLDDDSLLWCLFILFVHVWGQQWICSCVREGGSLYNIHTLYATQFKGSHTWDIQARGFYTNQTCMGPVKRPYFDTLFVRKQCSSLNYSLVSPPQNFWRYV